MSFPYTYSAGNANFLQAKSLDASEIQDKNQGTSYVIIGVPYDGAVTNRPGARFAPTAIRKASAMYCDATHPLFELSPIDQIADAGDLHLPNTSLAAMRVALEQAATDYLAKYHCVWLGGDHSITLSLLRALKQVAKHEIAVLHFDAHCDTWSSHFDEPSGHGTWVYEAVEQGLVKASDIVQIGIRSAAAPATKNYINHRGGLSIAAHELRGLDGAALKPIITQICNQLSHKHVYLTLDIDCLDPAFAPGTGTPEVAGLSTSQVASLLEQLVTQLNCIGMDCVEVSPAYDHADLTTNAAAFFVWTYLCGRIYRHSL